MYAYATCRRRRATSSSPAEISRQLSRQATGAIIRRDSIHTGDTVGCDSIHTGDTVGCRAVGRDGL